MITKYLTVLCVLLIFNFSNASLHDYGSELMLKNIKVWQNNLQEKELIPGAGEKCNAQLDLLAKLILAGPIMADNWAWRMLDAWGKMNAGILTGNFVALGQMDECLAIDEVYGGTEVKGQYCYSALSINIGGTNESTINTHNGIDRFRNLIGMAQRVYSEGNIEQAIPYSISICIPHECNFMELTGMDKVLDFDLCQGKDTISYYDDGDWAFIVFLIIVVVLVLISTCYDWYVRRTNKKPAHPVTLAFSFYTNSEKLLRVTNNPEQLQCLNGIRALSMVWVLTGHRFNSSTINPMVNLEYVAEWTQSWKSFYVSSAPVSVDSFFFISGVVMAYGFMKSQSKPKARFNIILYYIHRYLRLTPALAVLYFFYVTYFRHLTSGPIWPILQQQQQKICLDNAMSVFLYIQNIINPETQCMGHSWYLSVDMQLFIISPLILLPMVKFPKYAGYGLVALILLSILPAALITYFLDILYSNAEKYIKHYYYQPHTRISPWLVGLLLGYLFYQLRDRKIKIHRVVNLGIWAGILIGMFFILYVAPEMMATPDVSAFAVYNGFHRLCWALGLMWIVFACQNGYGGIVNWFLTLPIFQVLARLSYSMYLIHVIVQIAAAARKKNPIFFDDYDMLNQAFGDIIVVSFLAFLYCMMFESPMVVVEKILFGPNSYIIKLFGLCDKKKGRTEIIESSSQVTSQNRNASVSNID